MQSIALNHANVAVKPLCLKIAKSGDCCFCCLVMETISKKDEVVPRAITGFFVFSLVPSRPPRNLTAINKISPHKIQVTWERVPEEFMNGNLLNYLVTYQRVMIGDVPKDYEPELQKIVSVAQNVMLDNLEPYSKYKIRVAAKTAKGLGPYTAFTYGGKFSVLFLFLCCCFQKLRTRILDETTELWIK